MSTRADLLHALYIESGRLQVLCHELHQHGAHDAGDLVRDAGRDILFAIGQLGRQVKDEGVVTS